MVSLRKKKIPKKERAKVLPSMVPAITKALGDGLRDVLDSGWYIEIEQDERVDGFRVVMRTVPFYAALPVTTKTTPESLRRAGRRIGKIAIEWRANGCKETR